MQKQKNPQKNEKTKNSAENKIKKTQNVQKQNQKTTKCAKKKEQIKFNATFPYVFVRTSFPYSFAEIALLILT